MFTGVLRQSVLEESGNENTNTVRNTNTPTVITNSSNSNANVATVNLSPLDADQDGLSAEEEARLGTDPDDSDSDHDSLSDLMETTHQTNPLNPDTDNDGYLDGLEIRAGYNPLGPGVWIFPYFYKTNLNDFSWHCFHLYHPVHRSRSHSRVLVRRRRPQRFLSQIRNPFTSCRGSF